MRERQEKFAYPQQKVFKVDDHMALAMSGMTADASN